MTSEGAAFVTIFIDGQPVCAPAGSSVAAAILSRSSPRATGVGVGCTRISVSGERRAPLCGMGICHECRAAVDGRLRLACQTPCREGMHIDTAQEAMNGRGTAPRLEGSAGDSPVAAPASCDLLIVGAGPAGMAAALAAAPSGASIVMLDDNPAPGGQIWRDGPGAALPQQARAMRDALERHANIRILTGCRVVGLGGARGELTLLLENAEGGWAQRAGKVILCTGARELLLPFPGWTLPGVTGAGGLQALVKAGLPVAGQRIVVAGTGPLLLATANTVRKAGGQVVRIAEQSPWRHLAAFAAQLPRWPAKAAQALTLLDRQFRAHSHVVEAMGDESVSAVRVHRGAGRHEEIIACDRLACGFGLVPNTQLGELMGCALGAHDGLAVDSQQATTVPGIHAAGECTGFGGSERALAQGAIAGHSAVGDMFLARALQPRLARWDSFAVALRRHFALREELKSLPRPDTLVCRCEDVSYAEVAARSGWIDAKLHTRCGMGACQGRVCGGAMQFLLGWRPAPPRHLLSPARIGTLAGCSTTPAPSGNR